MKAARNRVRAALVLLRNTPGWAVICDARGRLDIVDAAGIRPLEHPDNVQRLFAVHLAASAPQLRNALQDVTHRLEYLHMTWPTDRRDEKRIQIAHGALIASRPMPDEIERALERQRRQTERRVRGRLWRLLIGRA